PKAAADRRPRTPGAPTTPARARGGRARPPPRRRARPAPARRDRDRVRWRGRSPRLPEVVFVVVRVRVVVGVLVERVGVVRVEAVVLVVTAQVLCRAGDRRGVAGALAPTPRPPQQREQPRDRLGREQRPALGAAVVL